MVVERREFELDPRLLGRMIGCQDPQLCSQAVAQVETGNCGGTDTRWAATFRLEFDGLEARGAQSYPGRHA